MYWTQSKQERRLSAVYEKWVQKGGVWSAGSAKVHFDQLGHVKRGCLARLRQDVCSDGSRIEGSHKGWNSLQRLFSSGIEVFASLGHDFVLRRNLRIASAQGQSHPEEFVQMTFGSHHIQLINFVSRLYNLLYDKEQKRSKELRKLPTLTVVDSREIFGLTPSDHTESFGGLLTIKEEEDEKLGDQLGSLEDNESLDPEAVLQGLGVDLELFLVPQAVNVPCVGEEVPVASVVCGHVSSVYKANSSSIGFDSGC